MRPAECRRLRSSRTDRSRQRIVYSGRVSRLLTLLRSIHRPCRAPGHCHDDRHSLFEPVELESEVRSKLMLQARARGRYADALLKRRERGIGKSEPVVADLDPELLVFLSGADINVT